jgi:hypothetical protein
MTGSIDVFYVPPVLISILIENLCLIVLNFGGFHEPAIWDIETPSIINKEFNCDQILFVLSIKYGWFRVSE